MKDYQLGFIPNETIFNHVKQTVELYRAHINLKEFNKNIIDPIKLTFDSKVYGKTFEEIIEAECIRQIDKTNSNNRQDQFQPHRLFPPKLVPPCRERLGGTRNGV